MALKINTQSPEWPEIFEILHRFADHAKFCGMGCSVKGGKIGCQVGHDILFELSKFKSVEEVPENWQPEKDNKT